MGKTWALVFLLLVLAAAEPASQPSSDDVLAILEEDLVASMPDIFDILKEESMISVGVTKPTRVTEAPSSSWAVSRFTLDTMPALFLHDALRLIPGIITREYSLQQTENHLRFVGSFPDNQALVVIDGRPQVAEGWGMFDKQMISLQDIERIEVVVGPRVDALRCQCFQRRHQHLHS